MAIRGSADRLLFQAVPKLDVRLNGEASLEQVLEVVKTIYGRTGCDNCGRLSFSLDAIREEIVFPGIAEIGKLDAVEAVGIAGQG
ncbi:MAG: hypothetical protein JWN95_3243 [Frankiales bacterium]|nr:hypothetical protein [Frankiales bacterium]